MAKRTKKSKTTKSKPVSVTAWNKSLNDINKRFNKIEKLIKPSKQPRLDIVNKKIKDLDDRIDKKVSNKAWQTVVVDIEKRLERIGRTLSQKSPKVESIETIKNQIAELDERIDNKVSNKAWERSLMALDRQFKDLALKELEELDDRLDKTVESINQLTNNLNKKVNVAAWDRLCISNEQLSDRVDSLTNKTNTIMEKLMEINNTINEARVSEKELKKLLESI